MKELRAFADGQPSEVDALIPAEGPTCEDLDQDKLDLEGGEQEQTRAHEASTVADVVASAGAALQLVQHDADAVGELIQLATEKLWRLAYEHPESVLEELQRLTADAYADEIRKEFLTQYEGAEILPIPDGYGFTVNGALALPNLMQRRLVWQLSRDKVCGNWSGTGAGKTNSAIYASRVLGAQLTLITCPTNTVEMWRDAIWAMYPDSSVTTRTLYPNPSESPRYLVVPYDLLQTDDAPEQVRALAAREPVEMIVVDEIQLVKQRQEHLASKRRTAVRALADVCRAQNPGTYLLGMSATPVINSLREGTSLLEILTGQAFEQLQKPTVPNCLALHRAVMRYGLRWVPDYQIEYEELQVPVSCEPWIKDILSLRRSTPLDLEKLLTRARLPVILSELRHKTIVYTHNVEDIVAELQDAIEGAGWSTGVFIGDDKSGMEGFVHGSTEVLIASSAIALGIDGLQHVCNNIIINVLPWTHAEFQQLKGRIYRQGQTKKTRLVIPVTYAAIGGQRWSWCERKLERIRFKRTIGDAVADGVVPKQQVMTVSEAYQQALSWLARLNASTPRELEAQT